MRALADRIRERARRHPRVYAGLRRLKRQLGAAVDALAPPLPPEAYRASLALDAAPQFQVGLPRVLEVRVTNASPCAWPRGRWLALSYHWRRADGTVWAFDGRRTRFLLTSALPPGQAVAARCTVQPPSTLGTYVLEIDLVHGRDRWFAAHGSQPLRQEVAVSGARPETMPEVDYQQIYERADLAVDFWSVVGPASAEEFRLLGQGKLDMLRSLGLRPDSRILDVGCGTGSLAEAASRFMGEQGLFYGTDLSEVAVQFCRQRYPQRNFRFVRNEMTRLPIEHERFDWIVFFSVFTHTYPAETRELLAEAARLLAPGGTIVADVFECDIEGETLGTRSMVVVDRRFVPALADSIGLEAQTLGVNVWEQTEARRIDRVLRRFDRRRPAAS